jgi:hypothetical protein
MTEGRSCFPRVLGRPRLHPCPSPHGPLMRYATPQGPEDHHGLFLSPNTVEYLWEENAILSEDAHFENATIKQFLRRSLLWAGGIILDKRNIHEALKKSSSATRYPASCTSPSLCQPLHVLQYIQPNSCVANRLVRCFYFGIVALFVLGVLFHPLQPHPPAVGAPGGGDGVAAGETGVALDVGGV